MNRFILILITLTISSSFIIAQTGSAYSRYGIGDLDFSYSAKMLSIGGIGSAQLDQSHIITTNPASWSALDRTRIEMGIGYTGLNLSNSVNNYFTSETEFKGFTFGFPVSSKYGIGVALGLIPYSTVSYKSVKNNTSTDPNVPDYSVTFEGKGGISKLFVGSSVGLPFGFIGGASFDYYFGNLRYFSEIEFIDNTTNLNTNYENNIRATGFGTSVGLISPNLASSFGITALSDLRFGLSANYMGDLNTDTLLTATSISLIDTLSNYNTKMSVPLRINGGISFEFSQSYKVNLDYSYQAWSDYKLNNIKNNNLRNAQRFSTGFEYTPKRVLGMSLWEQIVWRGGLSYEQTQYKFNDTGIDQFSVFGGFSFPMGVENSIDVGLQYAIRGTNDNNLLKENFVKIYLGISFGELWFLRYEK